MKVAKFLLTTALLTSLAASLNIRADDKKTDAPQPDTKAKPYPLDKCIVSDEKFEGSEMKPHAFVYQGQTFKLCCKECLKDFNKDSKKYVTKLADEKKKLEKANAK